MQRRRPAGGNPANPFQHGSVATFTKNMDKDNNKAPSPPRSNKVIIIAMVTFLFGIFYVEQHIFKVDSNSNANANANANAVFADPHIPDKSQPKVRRGSVTNASGKNLVQITTSGGGKDIIPAVQIQVITKPKPLSTSVTHNDKDEEEHSHGGEVIKVHTDKDATALDNDNTADKSMGSESKAQQTKETKELISKIRQEFYTRYGGKKEALEMLTRGILSASDTPEGLKKAIDHTAERIILARQNSREFVISFGGYSVTVGRGNYYNQSYPFIMQKVLQPVFEAVDLKLVVRNSAIGGIPSFPYGWCLPNFLGSDSDVVSWDYGMNEGNDANAFESYMRHSIATLPKRPMMIMLDNKRPRVDMMKWYHQNGGLLDSIAVGRGDVVKKTFLKFNEDDEKKPIGFRKWLEWGAPKGSPGQSNWHPKKMEHELIAWMIAMRFLDALDAAIDMLDNNVIVEGDDKHVKLALLPPPISMQKNDIGPATPARLLYGIPLGDARDDAQVPWHMDPVSCRTSFLPNIQGGLAEIVVSGLAEDVGDDLKSRDDTQYSSGWVVDVGKVERETKRKVEKVGGLGYIDMKNALYGIPESGTLRLSLPHERPVHNHPHDQDSDMLARHWFDTLVFCEVNEKRGKDECTPEKDMAFVVGGVKSKAVQITNAAAYLKKSICINVDIPVDARVMVKDTGDEGTENAIVELTVDVSVSNKSINRKNGACSISHVVWQSH